MGLNGGREEVVDDPDPVRRKLKIRRMQQYKRQQTVREKEGRKRTHPQTAEARTKQTARKRTHPQTAEARTKQTARKRTHPCKRRRKWLSRRGRRTGHVHPGNRIAAPMPSPAPAPAQVPYWLEDPAQADARLRRQLPVGLDTRAAWRQRTIKEAFKAQRIDQEFLKRKKQKEHTEYVMFCLKYGLDIVI